MRTIFRFRARGWLPLVLAVAACQAPPFAGTLPSSAVRGANLSPLALTASSRTISGTATLGTAAFSAASIQVRRIDDDVLLGTAITNADGSFTLELNPEPPSGTPLRVSATKDGRTLAALAFAGRREGARYRLSQAAAPAAFVALNPASTLALAAFLKRIRAVALELKLPQNQAIVLNALPFLLEAYEKAKIAAAETLENILASATAAGASGGPAAGKRPDLGNLSAVEQQVLERVLEGLLTAVQPLGDIELPPDIVTAITAADSPLREVAENVLTLLNEAVEVATEETLRSPPPSLSPEVWASELPLEASATPNPDETASDGVSPTASPDDLSTRTTSLPSPTPTPRSGGGGGSSSVAATPPPAGFAFDAFEPFEALGLSATAESLPSDALPGAMAVSSSSWYYLDANPATSPGFEASSAIRDSYRYTPPARGILRDSAHAALSATPACFVVSGATPGELFFADESHVYKYAAASATLWLGGLDNVTALASDGTDVYVAEGGSGGGGGRVSRVSQNDPTVTSSVLAGFSWPTDLAIVGSDLFVLDRGRDHDGTLQSVNTGDLTVTLLASGQNQPLALAGAGTMMYFTALQEGRRVLRAVRSGDVGNVFNVLPGGVYVHPYLQADSSNLYVLTSPLETAALWLGGATPPLPNHVSLLLLPFSGGPAKLMSTFAGRTDPLGLVVKDGNARASFGGSNRGVMNVTFVDG